MVVSELAKMCIFEIEKEIELERLRRASGECSGHNKLPYKLSSSHTGPMAVFREKSRLINLTLKFVQFLRQVDEILFWMREKETYVTSEDFGQGLKHVETFQERLDEFINDPKYQESRAEDIYWMADELLKEEFPEDSLVIEKSRGFGEALERLKGLTKERQSKLLKADCDTLITECEKLKGRAVDWRGKLEESLKMHRFLADWRDLSNWMNDMKTLISADDLAKDVAGAEAQVERHKEYTAKMNS
ncbi:unnamed protein product [Trichobilharzia regenti]|nr:unnamed protein product [Trichobilharzia regenti]